MITYLRATSAITAAFILAACAANPVGTKPKAAAADTVAQNPACLTETGSRITGSAASCSGVGHAYSRDDIDRTGATSADEALHLMDPSVTVHH